MLDPETFEISREVEGREDAVACRRCRVRTRGKGREAAQVEREHERGLARQSGRARVRVVVDNLVRRLERFGHAWAWLRGRRSSTVPLDDADCIKAFTLLLTPGHA